MKTPQTIDELPTPSLVVERSLFEHNLATMDAALPGKKLRPHVKAFKSTAIAKRLAADGHTGFCAATVAELEGMVAAGLTDDLMLANQTLQSARLRPLVDQANITIAIDSNETLDAAVAGGVRSVIIDICVGMPRCGCTPTEGARLAERARSQGVEVVGVMGYEGHLMMVLDQAKKQAKVEESMAILLQAHELIGGDIISGGGTGTYASNTWVNEIQAGSYTLMDTDYDRLDLPFKKALGVLGTIVSVNAEGWMVADAGLKAFGMDHGNPTWPDGDLMFCADEHTTLVIPKDSQRRVGERVRLWPAHVDPTVAKHERMWVLDGEDVVDCWDIDLRHW